jgi:CubicO group peptidase (beta-lactamase class C family)
MSSLMVTGQNLASPLLIHQKVSTVLEFWVSQNAPSQVSLLCFHDEPDLTFVDFFRRFGERPPVYAPYAANIVYSNAGWAIMGWVIEKVSGMPSGEFIKKHIWDPTGMDHTFFEEPDSSLGFVALNDVWWNATLGYGDP